MKENFYEGLYRFDSVLFSFFAALLSIFSAYQEMVEPYAETEFGSFLLAIAPGVLLGLVNYFFLPALLCKLIAFSLLFIFGYGTFRMYLVAFRN